ncbi:MAG: type II toxin-antitoxin system HicB family antitoxin [Candidatus Freyarchaeum deiterrae]
MIRTEFVVVLEPDVEGKGYVAFCPTLPGCFSQGDTREEALANIKEAIEAYIESLKKDGLPVPVDTKPEVTLVKVYE